MDVAKRVVLALLCFVLCTYEAFSQPRATPPFEVDAVSTRGAAGHALTRLDVYTKVPYDRLTFLRSADGFSARYEMTVEAHRLDDRGRRQELAQTETWTGDVTLEAFGATQSDRLSHHTRRALALAPGSYLLAFRLQDLHTRAALTREVAVEVRDLRGRLALSDLVLIEDYDPDTHTIYPHVSPRVETSQLEVQVFYEIYAARAQRVRVSREVVRLEARRGGLRWLLFGRRGAEPEEVLTYTNEAPTTLRAGRNPSVVEIPLDHLRTGQYVVRVRLENDAGEVLAEAERALFTRDPTPSNPLADLDAATEQLAYIAKDRQVRYIQEGATPAERRRRFQAFWAERDPTPGTPRNERMEEYYARIASANRRLGPQTNAWKTDRGHVMVLFGEPDYVDRPARREASSPDDGLYEVWSYPRIGRRFIFVDEARTGDFRLVTPIWDERTRIR